MYMGPKKGETTGKRYLVKKEKNGTKRDKKGWMMLTELELISNCKNISMQLRQLDENKLSELDKKKVVDLIEITENLVKIFSGCYEHGKNECRIWFEIIAEQTKILLERVKGGYL